MPLCRRSSASGGTIRRKMPLSDIEKCAVNTISMERRPLPAESPIGITFGKIRGGVQNGNPIGVRKIPRRTFHDAGVMIARRRRKIFRQCVHLFPLIRFAREQQIEIIAHVQSQNRIASRDPVHAAVRRIRSVLFDAVYISLLSEVLQYPIPIFCDSPSGREVEKSTIDGMLNILKRDYSHHQLVLASIYKYSEIFPKAKIIETNGTLFNKQTLFD